MRTIEKVAATGTRPNDGRVRIVIARNGWRRGWEAEGNRSWNRSRGRSAIPIPKFDPDGGLFWRRQENLTAACAVDEITGSKVSFLQHDAAKGQRFALRGGFYCASKKARASRKRQLQ